MSTVDEVVEPRLTAPSNDSIQTPFSESLTQGAKSDDPIDDAKKDDDDDDDDNDDASFRNGEVVWCLQSGNPWWPALVTNDFLQSSHRKKTTASSGKPTENYHVQFFGPQPLHAWVGEASLRLFTSPDDTENWRKQELTSSTKISKTRRERIANRYTPATKRLRDEFSAARLEAAKAFALSHHERLRRFEFEYRASIDPNLGTPLCYVPRKPTGTGERNLAATAATVTASAASAASAAASARKETKKRKLNEEETPTPPRPSAETECPSPKMAKTIDETRSVIGTRSRRRSGRSTPERDAASDAASDAAKHRGVSLRSNDREASPFATTTTTTKSSRTIGGSAESDDRTVKLSFKKSDNTFARSAESSSSSSLNVSIKTLQSNKKEDRSRQQVDDTSQPKPDITLEPIDKTMTSNGIPSSVLIRKIVDPVSDRTQSPSRTNELESTSKKTNQLDAQVPQPPQPPPQPPVQRPKSAVKPSQPPPLRLPSLSPRTEVDLFKQFCLCHFAEMKRKLSWLSKEEVMSLLEEHWNTLDLEERLWYVYNFLTPEDLISATTTVKRPNEFLRKLTKTKFVFEIKEKKEKDGKSEMKVNGFDEKAASNQNPSRVSRKSETDDTRDSKVEKNCIREAKDKMLQPKQPPQLQRPVDGGWEIDLLAAAADQTAQQELVCQVCFSTCVFDGVEDVAACQGPCLGVFHASCLEGVGASTEADFECADCRAGRYSCFVCHVADATTRQCSVSDCWKFYHDSCLRSSPSFEATEFRDGGKTFKCPRHVCHVCWLEDSAALACRSGKLVQCVKCPSSFHAGDLCLPAGSKDLGGLNIICPSHFGRDGTGDGTGDGSPAHVGFCFSCAEGGALICCESCPAAFHKECLDMKEEPKESWFCDHCRIGKKPRYGDVVWAKLPDLRWWPAEICHPRNLPDTERRKESAGHFPIRLLGSRRITWSHAGRVYDYQDGDSEVCKEDDPLGEDDGASDYIAALEEAMSAFAAVRRRRDSWRQKLEAGAKRRPPAYQFIRTNEPFGHLTLPEVDVADIPVCECKEDKACVDDDCLNRLLMYECHPSTCPRGDACRNQRFRKRLYPKLKVFSTDNDRGWGLKVLEKVKRGDFISEYVGELIDEEEARRRLSNYHSKNETNFYLLTIDANTIIDAGPKGNHSRFINHSCDPNCETQKWTVDGATRVGVFAKRDIDAGSELTFNYQFECRGDEKTPCNCGAASCSGFLGERPKPLESRERREKDAKAASSASSSGTTTKRRKKSKPVKVTDNWCFRCLEGGRLVLCDQVNCSKGYHLECLGRETLPSGKWRCPRHFCDYCVKTATRHCVLCPAAFCAEHDVAENIYEWRPEVGVASTLVCTDHSAEELVDRRESLRKGEVERDEYFRELERKREARAAAGTASGEAKKGDDAGGRCASAVGSETGAGSSSNISSEAGEDSESVDGEVAREAVDGAERKKRRRTKNGADDRESAIVSAVKLLEDKGKRGGDE